MYIAGNMNDEADQVDITKRTVVLQIPDMDAVFVQRDIAYAAADDGVLSMDVYYPPDFKNDVRLPTVIFVLGYSDKGFQRLLGCKQKEMASYISWSRLVAASGLAAVTYTTTEPEIDIISLTDYIRGHANQLGIDEHKIGVWACSGNVPNALSLLMKDSGFRPGCAVLNYGFTLDMDGASTVADTAGTYKFVNPSAGKAIDDLRPETPVLIVRAGKDENAGLNETMDSFLVGALNADIPISLINQPEAPHAFDLINDTEQSCRTVRQILSFLSNHLGPE